MNPPIVNLNLETQLNAAIKAAEEACKEILRIYDSELHEVEIKADDSPVTLADRRSHDIIAEILMDHFALPLLSEENKHIIHYAERARWNDFWMVDPLDGTKEFLKRNDEFTVNIALISENTPVLGIVAVPVTGEVYYGISGGGAFLKHGDSLRRLPRREAANMNQQGLRVIASRSHMNEQTESFIAQLKNPNMVAAGSSLKFMAVAKGEADIYPRFIPSMEWDTAAAHVIIKEVGLEIKNAYNGEPLYYNKENLLNPYFICQ